MEKRGLRSLRGAAAKKGGKELAQECGPPSFSVMEMKWRRRDFPEKKEGEKDEEKNFNYLPHTNTHAKDASLVVSRIGHATGEVPGLFQ